MGIRLSLNQHLFAVEVKPYGPVNVLACQQCQVAWWNFCLMELFWGFHLYAAQESLSDSDFLMGILTAPKEAREAVTN